jgi:hypothetical protein
MRLMVWLASLLALSSMAAGCGVRTTSAERPTATPRTAAPVPLQALTPSQKRSAIASNFPAEVPVPVGSITRAHAQDDTAWDYEVVAQASPEEFIGWYRRAYVNRGWAVLRDGEWDGPTGGGPFLELGKGGAQSSVRVSKAPSGTVGSSARVIVGFGPILQTQ